MKLSKVDFSKRIKKYTKHQLAQEYIIDVLNAIPLAVKEILLEGNTVAIHGMCEFTTKTVKGRQYKINVGPRAGESGSSDDKTFADIKLFPKFKKIFEEANGEKK